MGREGRIPNIGVTQCRQRLVFGVVLLLASAGVLAALLAIDAGRLWRLAVFAPLWAGFIGFFQYRQKTCVMLAARALRDMSGSPEPIHDADELDQVRRQARGVHVNALVTAAGLTALALMVPA